VILEETEWHNRWELGPCSSDGYLERMENGTMKMTPGNFSTTGPRCMLKQVDGVRAGRCLDFESERLQPGGEISVYPCMSKWHQFLSFGNGVQAPVGSMHMNIPMHIWKRIENSGREQEPYMCIAVRGRGHKDEEEWIEDTQEEEEEYSYDDDYLLAAKAESSEQRRGNFPSEGVTQSLSGESAANQTVLPLSHWKDQQLITTRCTNTDAVVEFVIVPFIIEDKTDPVLKNATNHTGSDEMEEDEL